MRTHLFALTLIAIAGCALPDAGFIPSVDSGADAASGLSIDPDRLALTEGTSGTLTVTIAPPPTENLVVDLSIAGGGIGLDPTQVTLGPGIPAADVTVTALPDDDAEDISPTVTATAANLAATTAIVAVTDDDELHIATNLDRLDITDITNGDVTVHLTAEPPSDVVVTVGIDSTIASSTAQSLTFSRTTWRDDQPITVIGVHDDDTLDESTALTLTASFETKAVAVNVRDSDRLILIATPSTLDVTEEAPGVTFDVYLSQQPPATESVTIAPQGPVRVSTTNLEFRTDNWSTPQRVTVSADRDDDVLGFATTIALTAPAIATAPALTAEIGVTVHDDDQQALRVVAASPLRVGEAGSADVTVALAYQPQADVVVGITLDDPTAATVNPSALTFHTNDWNVPQPVTITGRDDIDVANDATTIRIASAPLPEVALATTIVDDDVLGLTITGAPASLVEGASATIMVGLDHQPSAPLDVAITSADTGAVTALPTPLSFTPLDYAPRPVMVRAIADADLRDESVVVTFASPGNLTARTITVDVDDQTTLGIVAAPSTLTLLEGGGAGRIDVSLSTQPLGPVTVNVGLGSSDLSSPTTSLSFTDTTWMTPQPVTVSGRNDDDTTDDLTTVTLTSTDATTTTVNVTIDDDDSQAIVHDAPTPLSTVEDAVPASDARFRVHLAFQPAADVVVAVTSQNPTALTVDRTSLTFTPTTWSADQTIVVHGRTDANTTNESAAVRLQAGTMVVDVPVTVVDDDALGLVVTGMPTNLIESATATVMVSLDHAPAGLIDVTVSSTDTGAVTATPTTLSFGPSTYASPQPVTVRAISDVDLADESVTLTLASPGNLAARSFTVGVTDNTVLSVIAAPTALALTEGAAAQNLNISLSNPPLGNITVGLTATNGDIQLQQSSVTFTPLTWSTPQPVGISIAHDDDLAGESGVITLTPTPSGVGTTVNVTITDDDSQVLVEDAPPRLTTVEDAAAATDATFHVSLGFRPAANVAVTVASLNTAVATVAAGGSLTFTPSNWSVPQLVRVHGTTDLDLQNGSTVIRLTSGALLVDVPLDVTDDDVQVIQVESAALTATEGGTATLRVRLGFQPSANVTVSLASNNSDVTAPATVTIPMATYGTYVPVTVTTLVDGDNVNDTAQLTLTTPTAPVAPTVAVTVTDPTVIEFPGWQAPFTGSATLSSGTVLAYQVNVALPTTLDRLGLYATAAGGEFKMAVYADAANVPGALEAQVAGRQAISAAGAREVDISNVPLPAGKHWIAVRVSPSAALGHNLAATTTLRCSRTTTIPNLDDPWPATFGAASCANSGIYNLYLVTFRNP